MLANQLRSLLAFVCVLATLLCVVHAQLLGNGGSGGGLLGLGGGGGGGNGGLLGGLLGGK